jgi:hypothetical protein
LFVPLPLTCATCRKAAVTRGTAPVEVTHESSCAATAAASSVVVAPAAAHNRCVAQESKALDTSGSEHEAKTEQTPFVPFQTEAEGVPRLRRSWRRGLQDRLAGFEKSAAGRYWAHLSTADFMNSSFAFAALAVLSAFPFLAVSSSVIGGDIRKAIVARMGLDAQAKHDVEALVASGNQAVATLTWFSAIVLVLGGIGMASTLSAWYHRIYERTPPKGLLRHLVYQVAGVAAFTLYLSLEVWLFDKVRPVGGPGLIFLLTFVFAVLFWWWSSYMLLYGQSRCGKCSPQAWRPEPASPVSESSRRSSSRTRSPRGKRAMAQLASSSR